MNSSADISGGNCSFPCNGTVIPSDQWSDIEQMLAYLSEQKAIQYAPVLIFMSILMFTGTIGNMLILYVYYFCFKKTSSRYFILSLAIYDLIACLIGMPTELFDLGHSYTFYSGTGCRITRYAETVTVYGSVIILIEIAFDRYFKICYPLRITSICRIKCMCIISGIISVVISIPTILLSGIARASTEIDGLFGYDCSINDTYKESMFAKIFYGLIALVFAITLFILSALYIRIWIEIRRRKNMVIGESTVKKLSHTSDDGGKYSRQKHLSSISDDESNTGHLNNKCSVNIENGGHRLLVEQDSSMTFASNDNATFGPMQAVDGTMEISEENIIDEDTLPHIIVLPSINENEQKTSAQSDGNQPRMSCDSTDENIPMVNRVQFHASLSGDDSVFSNTISSAPKLKPKSRGPANKQVFVRTKILPSISQDESLEYNYQRQHSTFYSLKRKRLDSIVKVVNKIRVSRTTKILFAVTVAFVVSYLPAIVIMILRSTDKRFKHNLNSVEDVVCKLFSKFYFINNAINPVIYSFLNVNFRAECTVAIRKAIGCVCARRGGRRYSNSSSGV